jgi:hypothetical protein
MRGNLDLNQGATGYESHLKYHSERQRLKQNQVFIGKGIEVEFRWIPENSGCFLSIAEKNAENFNGENPERGFSAPILHL